MITMVIPTYNHAQYLPIQIASIIRQGPSVVRIIVVNDGSTDDTVDVLAKIQLNEPRLMVKNLTDNVGWMRAAHIGVSYVETDFFAIVSADDCLIPGWAEKSLNALRSAPDIALCLAGTYLVREASSLTKTVLPKRLRGAVLSPLEFHRSVMQYGSWFASGTMLIRRSNYDENFVEFASAGSFADGLTIYVLGLKAGVVVIDEPLGVFFERRASVSGATIAPSVGTNIIQELSNLLSISPCVKLIDRRLASRILQRNTYMYLMEAAVELTYKYSQLAESTLPSTASRALRISLRLLFFLYRLVAFACLRPFDFKVARVNYPQAANVDETRAFCEYQKELNKSLDLSRFDAAPLIAFTATKETDYGTETNRRI